MAKYTTTELLKLAESHYQKAEYDQALKLFQDNRDIVKSPSLWHYNVGSIYLKKNELGPARYHLEKAKHSYDVGKLASRNISSVLKNDFIMDLSKSDSVFEAMISRGIGSGIWDYTLLFSFLFLATILLFRFKKITKKILIVGVIVSLTPFAFYVYFKNNFRTAIVIKDSAVREGPSKIYDENILIPAGSQIVYSMSKNGWFLVELPKEIRGWVESNTLRTIGD